MNGDRLSAAQLVQKVWNYAHVLKDDGLAFMDYTEQITYLLFLKMASERKTPRKQIPAQFRWAELLRIPSDSDLLAQYHEGILQLSEKRGLIGLIFTKPQSKINDPAKLRRLMKLIDGEHWSSLDVDVKGEVYEGLLARNAEDVRGGAGQYFTPRPVVRAVVEVMRPRAGMVIADPACGTGGFLVAAHEYLCRNEQGDSRESQVSVTSIRGMDLVPNVARLCAMNLFLRNVDRAGARPSVTIGDSLVKPMEPVDMILTNPPFGKKSSFTVIGEGGRKRREGISYDRNDFWATTSNKQLNFLQHVYASLKADGKAAVVVPDNVLFESGAGEKVRRALLSSARVHTLLRLPAGIWYSPGVKANVLFFEKTHNSDQPATEAIWVYDLRRTRDVYSLRKNPIRDQDLCDFVESYRPDRPAERSETDSFRRFPYSEVAGRDGLNLDFHWSGNGDQISMGDKQPEVLLQEIVECLGEAMDEFQAAGEELR